MGISTLRRRDIIKLYWEKAPADGPLTRHPAGVRKRPKGIVRRPWRGHPSLAEADAFWRRGRTNEQILQDSLRGKTEADPHSLSSIKLALRCTRQKARAMLEATVSEGVSL
jgi:hypothetical protein